MKNPEMLEALSALALEKGISEDVMLEALANAVLNGDITPEDLDAALGNGPLLTKLVQQAPLKHHKGLVFRTPWDEMRKEKGP